jgi:hypothetical protein
MILQVWSLENQHWLPREHIKSADSWALRPCPFGDTGVRPELCLNEPLGTLRYILNNQPSSQPSEFIHQIPLDLKSWSPRHQKQTSSVESQLLYLNTQRS